MITSNQATATGDRGRELLEVLCVPFSAPRALHVALKTALQTTSRSHATRKFAGRVNATGFLNRFPKRFRNARVNGAHANLPSVAVAIARSAEFRLPKSVRVATFDVAKRDVVAYGNLNLATSCMRMCNNIIRATIRATTTMYIQFAVCACAIIFAQQKEHGSTCSDVIYGQVLKCFFSLKLDRYVAHAFARFIQCPGVGGQRSLGKLRL